MTEHIRGNLLIIGGAEDKKGECKLLGYFVQEAKGSEGIISIVTAATLTGEESGENYRQLFAKLGCRQAKIINITKRQQANSEVVVEEIAQSTGVFFTGGDQLRITALLGGTALGRKLQEMYEQNIIIAGTSAGASVMSDTMIIGGQPETPKEDSIRMAPGLGLIKGVVIDQHFTQRGRMGRVLTAAAMNPYVLGLGIDEDTAVHVTGDASFKVLGRGTVLVVDASTALYSNVEELSEIRPLTLSPVTTHVLSSGCSFNLLERTAGIEGF